MEEEAFSGMAAEYGWLRIAVAEDAPYSGTMRLNLGCGVPKKNSNTNTESEFLRGLWGFQGALGLVSIDRQLTSSYELVKFLKS